MTADAPSEGARVHAEATEDAGSGTGGPGGPVLLTAFEPFDGQVVNASALAVEAVAAGWTDDVPLVTAILPVSFRGARQRLRELVAEHGPRLVLVVGEAGGRGAVGLERVALNVVDARIPDADGSAPVDVPVVAGAPAAFFARLPLKAMLVAVRAVRVQVEVSGHAGTFVCNATAYALLHLLERSPRVRGGLVHVPRTPEQVAPGEPAMATADAATALLAALGAALRTDGDVRLAAGSEG